MIIPIMSQANRTSQNVFKTAVVESQKLGGYAIRYALVKLTSNSGGK